MPNVFVSFTEKGITAIERSQRGVIAMIFLVNNPSDDVATIYTVDDIPEDWSDYKTDKYFCYP